MIERDLHEALLSGARHYPVVTVTGPRQSGKTTLCRASFPDKDYVSLEPMDTRSFARDDPRGFLAEHTDGGLTLIDVKSAATMLRGFVANLDKLSAALSGTHRIKRVLVYGGEERGLRFGTQLHSWRDLDRLGPAPSGAA